MAMSTSTDVSERAGLGGGETGCARMLPMHRSTRAKVHLLSGRVLDIAMMMTTGGSR